MKELTDKTLVVDTVAGWLDELPIQELMYRMDNIEAKTTKTSGFERGDNSTGSAGLIEE